MTWKRSVIHSCAQLGSFIYFPALITLFVKFYLVFWLNSVQELQAKYWFHPISHQNHAKPTESECFWCETIKWLGQSFHKKHVNLSVNVGWVPSWSIKLSRFFFLCVCVYSCIYCMYFALNSYQHCDIF